MKKPRFKRKLFDVKKLKAWAKKVKLRDKFCCKGCGYKGYLHSHHILPKSKFPKYVYSVWNGITLCKLCHMGKNGVHGRGRPRNDLVKKLRSFLKGGNVNEVKSFNSTIDIPVKKNIVYNPYIKKKRKGIKRKLY